MNNQSKQNTWIRRLEIALLLPGTLLLGIGAFVAAIASVSGAASGLVNRPELAIAYIFYFFLFGSFFAIPATGFILLWILVLKGAEWVAAKPVIAWLSVILGGVSFVIGLFAFSGAVLKTPTGVGDLMLTLSVVIPLAIGFRQWLLLLLELFRKRNHEPG